MADETAAQRFARDWSAQESARITAGLTGQSAERKARIYVAPDGSTPADD